MDYFLHRLFVFAAYSADNILAKKQRNIKYAVEDFCMIDCYNISSLN